MPTLAGAGTYPMRARVTDLAGNQGTSATATVVVSSVTSWGTDTAQVLSSDPLQGMAQQQLGDVQVRHALDLDQSPGAAQSGNAALVFNSDAVSVKPLVQVSVPSANAVPGQTNQVLSGAAYVVAQDASPFGAGWTFAPVDTLISIAADANGPAGVLRVFGTGEWPSTRARAASPAPPGTTAR